MFGTEGEGSTAEGGCWGCARVTAGRRETRREGFIAFFLGRAAFDANGAGWSWYGGDGRGRNRLTELTGTNWR